MNKEKNEKMNEFFNGKNILVTGGTGSIGSQIVKQLLEFDPKVVRIFSRDETKQFNLMHELDLNPKLRFLIGDVRDKTRLLSALEDIDIVFHTAALKHVPSCEYNPFEAVKTNIIGTQNLIEATIERGVERVIMISTDKAANPRNTMGACKLVAERLILGGHEIKGKKRTLFSVVRFGNVLGSRGSVTDLFKRQIQTQSKITLTDPNMTRFMMSIPQAVGLVLEASMNMKGREIFILKMPVIKLSDLAEVMIEECCSKLEKDPGSIMIENIGLRPGEKQDEILLTEEESQFAYENDKMFILFSMVESHPTTTNAEEEIKNLVKAHGNLSKPEKVTFNSANTEILSKGQIKDLLYNAKIL